MVFCGLFAVDNDSVASCSFGPEQSFICGMDDSFRRFPVRGEKSQAKRKGDRAKGLVPVLRLKEANILPQFAGSLFSHL
jgi:hypothetical protein